MLDDLRLFSKTWVAKILLAVLVVSFAAFGINNVITDLGSNTIARVGDEDITARQFQRVYQQQLNAAAQQLGSIPTREQAVALGLPSAALSRLAAEAAIDKLGQAFGLGVSDERLSIMLRDDPAFSGTLGAFSRDAFTQVLQQNGMTEAEYFDSQAKSARRQQLAIGLFGDAAVPETAIEMINRYGSDKRTVDYFVLTAQALPAVAAPTEAELADYLKANQEKFRTVETRKAEVLVLSPEALAATKTISEEAIVAEYERSKATLTKAERRHIRQVTLTDPAALTLFETGKTAGKAFETLAAEAKLPVTDLGTLAQSQITDATLANAAFGLAQGDFVIIEGATGKRAVTVAGIEAGGQVPLDTARKEIAAKLALAEAKTEYADILDQIEELRAAFQPMQTIADRYNLKLATIDVTASGAELAAVPGVPEAERARIAGAIFAAEQGKLAPTISLTANHNVWIDLKGVEPARDQTLEEARDAVVAAWTNEQTDKVIAAEIARIEKQLDDGTPLAEIAAGLNQFPQLSQPFDRAGDGTPVISAAVANAVFAGGADHHGAAVNGDGDHVVFQVVEVAPASSDIDANLANYVTETTRDSIYGEFVTGLRDEAGLRVNEQALTQVLDLTSAGN